MSEKRYTQIQLTRLFKEQGNLSESITDLRLKFWVNPTDPNSLRLTLEGFGFTKTKLNLETYKFILKPSATLGELLLLERVFKGPYYLQSRTTLFLYEESEAVMLTLHSGNISHYLESINID